MTKVAKTPVILSCVNLKGGVGKTAISVNFAAYCAQKGYRTLLIDLDPQTNATFWCITVEDWQDHAKKHGTVANLLGARSHTNAEGSTKTAKDVIKKSVMGGSLDLLPSHLDLFTIDLDLGAEVARETKLKRALKDSLSDYDIIVCDCPPNLTIPTQNAIAASTHFVVPVSPDFLSSLGVALLLGRIQKFSDDLESPIADAGIVMSRVGRPSFFREQTIQSLRTRFPGKVFDTEIRERSDVAEAAGLNRSVFQMRNPDAIREFSEFGDELIKELGL
jgi:chromosome partitioning protein